VRYSGFVGGQTSAVLGGSLAVTRDRSALLTADPSSVATQDSAGLYASSLVPAGLTSSNYNISFVNGNYTIVPAGELMVRVQNISTTYGNTPTYNVTYAAYMADAGNGAGQITDLQAANFVSVSGAQVTVKDGTNLGANTTAQFDLGASNAVLSTAGTLKVGSYSLGASNVVVGNTTDFSNNINIIGAYEVTPKSLSVTAGGLTKVYDGSSAMSNLTLTPVGLVTPVTTADVVNVTGVGTYADKNVSALADKNYSLTSLALTGADAGNYVLTNGSTSAAITTQSGSDSQITPRPLTVAFTGIDRVYDGSTVASVNTGLTVANGFVSGDNLSVNRSAAFADKNVAYDGANNVTSKAVSITGVSLGGTDAANYSVAATGSTSATITPRVLNVAYTGINRVYDGGTVATVSTTDDRLLNDVFDINRTASYANKNVGGAKVVSVSGVGLSNPFGVSSIDATNYSVAATGSTTANITPRVLNVYYAGVNRVYDGGTVATVTTTDDRVSGDVFDINRSAGYADKNVGLNKAVSVSGVTITDPSGANSIDAANYSVVATGSTTAHITARPLTSLTAA
jgi:predicted DNA binding protein